MAAIQSMSGAGLEWPFDFSQYPSDSPCATQFEEAFKVMELVRCRSDERHLVSSNSLLSNLGSDPGTVASYISKHGVLAYSFNCLMRLLGHSADQPEPPLQSSSREKIITETFAKIRFSVLHFHYVESYPCKMYRAITVVDGDNEKVFSVALRMSAQDRHKLKFWDDSHLIFSKPKQPYYVQVAKWWESKNQSYSIATGIRRGSEIVHCGTRTAELTSLCTGIINCFYDVEQRCARAARVILTALQNYTSLPTPSHQIVSEYVVKVLIYLPSAAPLETGSELAPSFGIIQEST